MDDVPQNMKSTGKMSKFPPLACLFTLFLYVSAQRHTFAMKLSLAHLTSKLRQTHH